jgi:predicted dehydrogenase
MAKHRRTHQANIQHFVDVINGKAEPMYTIDQGINMIKILCAIYESAETGKEVLL